MSTEIRLARGDSEHRQAYALRAEVFVGEDILEREVRDDLLFDVFDSLPSCRTIVAIDNGAVVGTVRTSLHNSQPSPCDEFQIPKAVLPPGAVVGSGSMLCVAPSFRTSSLGLRLVAYAMRYLSQVGATHAVAAIRPEAEALFERLGWLRIAEPFVHAVQRVPIVPMVIGVAVSADSGGDPDG